MGNPIGVFPQRKAVSWACHQDESSQAQTTETPAAGSPLHMCEQAGEVTRVVSSMVLGEACRPRVSSQSSQGNTWGLLHSLSSRRDCSLGSKGCSLPPPTSQLELPSQRQTHPPPLGQVTQTSRGSDLLPRGGELDLRGDAFSRSSSHTHPNTRCDCLMVGECSIAP